jgi:hypothetical protein
MATKIDQQLFDRIRKLGVRKSRAKQVAEAVRNSPKAAPKAARRAMADLQGAAGEIQDRINGGPEKRKAAAKKAAKTRKANAKARSDRAKKAAKTRAKSAA